jgi:hypothetical protein
MEERPALYNVYISKVFGRHECLLTFAKSFFDQCIKPCTALSLTPTRLVSISCSMFSGNSARSTISWGLSKIIEQYVCFSETMGGLVLVLDCSYNLLSNQGHEASDNIG